MKWLSPLTVDFTVKIEGAMRRQGKRRLEFKGKQRDGTVSGRVWKGEHRLGGGGREGIRWRGQKRGERRCALRGDCADLTTWSVPHLPF